MTAKEEKLRDKLDKKIKDKSKAVAKLKMSDLDLKLIETPNTASLTVMHRGGELKTWKVEKFVPDMKATFAMILLERWGMVSATDGGEDSAGRAKLTKLSPNEVVTYATDVSAAAFKKFGEKGWLLKNPDLKKLLSIAEHNKKSLDSLADSEMNFRR